MSHIFLTGFMGAGKSTVGRLVAERLDRPFVDLDAVIERRENAKVAELFADRGESGFREAEHSALAWLIGEPDSVVATGGGVVLREDNQTLLKRHGTVIYLSVTPEEAMARLGDAGDRPLLVGEGLVAARQILEARLSLYRATADHVIDTVACAPADVATAVVRTVSTSSHVSNVRVGGDGDGYDLILGDGLLDEVGARVRDLTRGSRVALVSDEHVWAIYGVRVSESLRGTGLSVTEHVVPAGETSKSWVRAGTLLDGFAASGLDRASAVVALGGGVVGDLAGFCAAVFMRGIPLVHVPTTLLAQVDSAIGGKTGVDLRAGKNLAGAFWPPCVVIADAGTLQTLPETEWSNGLVEVAKAALLAGGETLERFERDLAAIVARDRDAVRSTVNDAAGFKASVVSEDLREAGLRECLNLGHTLGHALELATGYGSLPHGLAVAEGMRFAAALAERLVSAPHDVTTRTAALLESIGAGEEACRTMLAGHAAALDPCSLLAAMKRDKKSRDDVVRFVLLEAPGRWSTVEVEDVLLLEELARWVSRLEGRGA